MTIMCFANLQFCREHLLTGTSDQFLGIDKLEPQLLLVILIQSKLEFYSFILKLCQLHQSELEFRSLEFHLNGFQL